MKQTLRQLLPTLMGGVWGWIFFFTACTSPSVPTSYTDSDEQPSIYPDYVGVTVPVNIAPLHFHIDHDAEATDFVTRITAGNETWVGGSEDVCPGLQNWQRLLRAALAANGEIAVEVFTKQEGQWQRQKPFGITVSKDSIDPYITYRLI